MRRDNSLERLVPVDEALEGDTNSSHEPGAARRERGMSIDSRPEFGGETLLKFVNYPGVKFQTTVLLILRATCP